MSFLGGLGSFLLGLGGLDITGGLVNSWYQNKQNKKAQLRDQNFEKYMWDLQNEYNLPINQMERLRQAGLNPQLALGDVNTVASASLGGQSPTSYASVGLGLDKLDLVAKSNMIANTKLNQEKAETERVAQSQMKAQTMNTKEQTKFLGSQIKNIDADTRLKMLNYQLEDIKRQSGIIGDDMYSNISRSAYGVGKKAVEGASSYVKHLLKKMKFNFSNK